ncbi:MAG: helix-turn-helix domain-containing protein, partial [Candidatus Thalassarchaeaceae archaeon]|nr:helix-turn-helix domain-containing protein [Candidatus Thalassarchaeaceae archaeon]
EGVLQLAEVRLREGKSIGDLSEISWIEVMEILEEEEGVLVVSMLCNHPFAKSAIELSNIQVYPPYGIDSTRGMEIRMSGLSDSVSRFVSLLRVVLPPDKISVNSIRHSERNGWTDNLTDKQKEVISYAIRCGYFNPESKIKLKDIADSLGMARSTLGEHMKRAQYEIMKKVADDLN